MISARQMEQRLDEARTKLAEAARQFLVVGTDISEQEREALLRIARMDDGKSDLWRRARAVVDARYKTDGSWEELDAAIAVLADLTGGGELKHG